MKNIYLIVGPSGVGKTTVAELLEREYGFIPVESYTTRPARYEGETGHIFVSKEEFDQIGEMVAYTKYNGNEYGVTSEIIDRCDVYVIDPPGVEFMRERYKGRKGIVIIGLSAPKDILAARMGKRGDSEEKIRERLKVDAEVFDYAKYSFTFNVTIEADITEKTLARVKSFIDRCEGDDYDVRIYQINPERDMNRLMFANSDLVSRINGNNTVNLCIYDERWSGNMAVQSLEDVFRRFNSDDRPNAHNMHSLSVSDIVEIRHNPNEELNGMWFCDSFGWKKIVQCQFA